MKRRGFLNFVITTTLSSWLLAMSSSTASALSFEPSSSKMGKATTPSIIATNGDVVANGASPKKKTTPTVAYRPMLLDMKPFDVKVPVAMWYPIPKKDDENEDGSKRRSKSGGLILEFPQVAFAIDELVDPSETTSGGRKLQQGSTEDSSLTYNHRISIRRIGQLIAGWNFLPALLSRKIPLRPSSSGLVTDGTNLEPPKSGKVVFLAHGYLGSRFDLSHIAEALAQEGFICVSPEYPESLAASYERVEGLDRKVITDRVLEAVTADMSDGITSYGFVGHSYGCYTALQQSDDTSRGKWTRVLMAGSNGRLGRGEYGPPLPQSNILLIVSKNDSVTSMFSKDIDTIIPDEYVRLDEEGGIIKGDDDIFYANNNKNNRGGVVLPSKAALVLDRPNHISFLNDGVNQAMLNVLSPLLPVAKTLRLPVLDFDRYQQSQDAEETAKITVPLITKYLKQEM